MIMSEVYGLWAIESSNSKVKEVLSFAKADETILITANIKTHRELKLRLLNGTHSFSCALAFLAGFETVKEAMENKAMGLFIHDLIFHEIAPCLNDELISETEANNFSKQILDRFRNPFLDHKWISISLHYTHNMRMRNVPLLQKHFEHDLYVPGLMAMGFAGYLLFMRCAPGESGTYYGDLNGVAYPVHDERAGYFHQLWNNNEADEVVKKALGNENLWDDDLTTLPGFAFAVQGYLDSMMERGVLATLEDFHFSRENAEINKT
jgi:tagaturonate reductase